MRKFTISITLLFLFFTLPHFAVGQEVLTGLKQNSQLVKKSKIVNKKDNIVYEAVKLPFVEDFSTSIGYPNPELFMDKQGFVNNSYPLNPPTLGVVTLDALDAFGKVYTHASSESFTADTLTSRPIRLDSLFYPTKRVIRVQDSIYFSFYYQPGGGTFPDGDNFYEWERIGDQPETEDSLVLEFGYETGDTIFLNQFTYGDYILDTAYAPGDTIINPFMPNSFYIVENYLDSGYVIQLPMDSIFGPEAIWNHVWSTPGVSLDSWLAEDSLRYFKQVLIPITDYQYLRNNFQFRFRNYASLEDNGVIGWASNVDQWHIDYIQLNVNRTYTDSFPNDVAFVMPSQSMLKKYQAMPWSQFEQSELATHFENKLSNLSNAIKNTNYTYSVYKNGNISVENYTSNNENANPYYPNGLHRYAAHSSPAINFNLPMDVADSAVFTITHIFQEEGAGDSRKQNDTSVFVQKFYNYYAYDDGVAENGYSILSNYPNPEIALAVRFTLNNPDTLRAVRMWFNHVLNEGNEAPFTLTVWNDNQNKPGTVLYSQPAQLPAHEDEFLDFVTYYLEEPIAITGSFYVGFQQNHNIQLNIGFDCNNDGRQHFMYKTTNTWKEPFLKGTPMIRPVIGKYFAPDNVAIAKYEKINFTLYPNPTTNFVNLRVENDNFSFSDINYRLFDVFGKLIKTEKIADIDTKIDLSPLPAGFYFIQLSQSQQIITTAKIIKQ
ncbi:MAG TPA: T9SS type A sorting domain-containing protein [Bacteroidales bacterium]|nr:T9SS type A sorting domain-containing protein [Bacteroidales bacterium]HOS58358.1 T9SS type A sorting domain-containing protein [Bacteroidales bacterium]HRT14068.1 T9SS type A sorting domain-containing protein [Bacteroidales bacterium]